MLRLRSEQRRGAQGLPGTRAAGMTRAMPYLRSIRCRRPHTEQPGMYGVGEAAAEAALADSTAGQSEREPYGLGKRFLRGYPTLVLWFPRLLGPPRESDMNAREEEFRAGERSGGGGYESPDAPRRAPPSPWDSPPFPTSEYQGYPLIGVPPSATEDPMHKALLLGPFGDANQGQQNRVSRLGDGIRQLEQRPQFESADGLLDRAQLIPVGPS